MMSTTSADRLAAAIAAAVGHPVADRPGRAVGGGSINECVQWSTSAGPLFTKLAPADRLDMFEAEAEGLHELERAAAVRVPRVLGLGTAEGHAFLALEWLEFDRSTARSEALLGEQLAALHRVTTGRFGWHRDNTIGATPQRNDWLPEWPAFFARRRLAYQLDLAARNGHSGRWLDRGRHLCDRVGEFFADYSPQPSLLHGDLWGGNWATDSSGAPVLYDPAVYYGDREADLAMTYLFGGFSRAFYDAYHAAWPLDPGAGVRRDLYNLYHVVNHLNLFGGGYRAQAGAIIERLLAQLE
jgi:protein-ribulosamine 3-kinase